jgi:UDP-glucose 4-epimerase
LKKILVTGGAGFIGSHLCEELIKIKSNKIFSLDNYSTGSQRNHIEGVDYISGSTAQIGSTINFVPDIVYHLGEYSCVEQSFDDLDAIRESNFNGTFSVLQFCKNHKCKLVYAGSSTKFGDNGEGKSQSPYGYSKAANTELVENFGRWFGLQYAIVYFYNAYGPREIRTGKYATLIALFAELMSAGKDLTVVSPGDQVRNFTHVKDVATGLALVGEKGSGDGFGIGNDREYSILEVAKLFAGRISMLQERPGNRMSADLVVSKTKNLGWKTQHKLEDYIEKLRANNWVD